MDQSIRALTMRQPDEINVEVSCLLAMKPLVPQDSLSGDNHQAIDAQIETLTKLLSAETIYGYFAPAGEEADDDGPSEQEMYNVTSAQEANDWLMGRSDVTPHEIWEAVIDTADEDLT